MSEATPTSEEGVDFRTWARSERQRWETMRDYYAALARGCEEQNPYAAALFRTLSRNAAGWVEQGTRWENEKR
jgi:hypothetical protein